MKLKVHRIKREVNPPESKLNIYTKQVLLLCFWNVFGISMLRTHFEFHITPFINMCFFFQKKYSKNGLKSFLSTLKKSVNLLFFAL